MASNGCSAGCAVLWGVGRARSARYVSAAAVHRLTAGGCGVIVAHILAQHGGQVLVPHAVHLPHTCITRPGGCSFCPLPTMHCKTQQHPSEHRSTTAADTWHLARTREHPGRHLEVAHHKSRQAEVEVVQRVLCDLNTEWWNREAHI